MCIHLSRLHPNGCMHATHAHTHLLKGATNVWTWSSVLPKYTSEYTLWVEYTDGKTNSTREKKIEK